MRKNRKLFLLVLAFMVTGCAEERESVSKSEIVEADKSALNEAAAALEESEREMAEQAKNSHSSSISDVIILDGERFSGLTFEDLLEGGFHTDMDLSQTVPSCRITEEFGIYFGDAEMKIKVINPYENEIPISNCYVCSYLIEDASGTIQSKEGFQCGVTTMEEVEDYYAGPYKQSSNTLVYKGNEIVKIRRAPIMAGKRMVDTYDENDNGEIEITYEFQSGILKAFTIIRPLLLYNGLQDNIDSDLLADVDQNKFSGIIKVRDSILDEIKDALETANVSVSINEKTGEVAMDTKVLFATDEYALTEEGKAYMDEFFTVYVSVILDPDFSSAISGLVFEGHTDTAGTYDYNLELSQKRADAVMEYCLGLMDEESREKLERITKSIGYSFSDPVFTENGEVDMDASRRVALKFMVNVDSVE